MVQNTFFIANEYKLNKFTFKNSYSVKLDIYQVQHGCQKMIINAFDKLIILP